MTAPENDVRNSFVLMQVGTRRFALPAGIIAELAPPVRLHAFPHTTPIVVGVIVRRGHIVPVYDVAPILLGRSFTAHRSYLIALREFGNAREPSAIPVDGECELAMAEMEPPAAGQPAYISGRLSFGEESVDVLNLEALAAWGSSQTNAADHSEAPS